MGKGRRILVSRIAVVVVAAIAALTLFLGLTPTASASSWKDVPDSLLAVYGISDAQLKGISEGYSDGTFRPQQNITRAQFVKMANANFAVPLSKPTKATFSDVPLGHQYFEQIESAYKAKMINGVGGGRFAPAATITRQQGIAIIVRKLAAAKGFDLTSLTKTQINSALSRFSDQGTISVNLRPEMAYAVMNGITKGSGGRLMPTASVGRLVGATLLIRAATVMPPPPAAQPTITALSPTGGPAAGGTTVTITGTGFTGATAVKFGGTAANSFTVNSATKIMAVTPAGSGKVDVTVTTPGGTSANTTADDFTYTAAPTISSISPNVGPLAGGTDVVITGTGFTGATAVKFGNTDADLFTVVSATEITAVSPVHAAGKVDVRVTTPGGTSANTATDDFTFTTAPIITAISPAGGPVTGGTNVIITGINLSAASVTFGDTPAGLKFGNSDTEISVLSPAHAAGKVDIKVTTAQGTSANTATDDFYFGSPPTITALSPVSGSIVGGTTVTITGTDFTAVSAVKFGGTAATSFTVNSATQITAVSPAHAAGKVDVSVTTPTGTTINTAADDFTYGTAPSISFVSPTVGLIDGGTSVTITGANLGAATAVKFGGTAATSFTVNSATQIAAVSPAHAAGKVDITVTTAQGTSADTISDDFTYVTDLTPVTYQSYNLGAYRETSYGTPPDGLGPPDVPDNYLGSLAGCHLRMVYEFAEAVQVTDSTALGNSLSYTVQGVVFASTATPLIGQTTGPDPAYTTYTAAGNTLTIDAQILYLPGGIITIAADPAATTGGVLNGITVGGRPVEWEEIYTVVPTGLAMKTIAVTAGTATTPASTTMQVTHSANVRSMNHVIWLSDGAAIIPGTGTAQAPAAHHHNYWSFTTAMSAQFIAATGTISTLDELGYTVTRDGDQVTMTAKAPRAGEILEIKNFDDDFLQAEGLSLADHVTGASHPSITPIPDQTYAGSPVTPDLIINGTSYNATTSPAATYSDNDSVGTATARVTVDGCAYQTSFVIAPGAPTITALDPAR